MDKLIELFQTDWRGVTFLILYTGLLFSGWSWMLNISNKPIKEDIVEIKTALNNHLSETNKKIDNLNNRFDKLYQILLKDKQK